MGTENHQAEIVNDPIYKHGNNVKNNSETTININQTVNHNQCVQSAKILKCKDNLNTEYIINEYSDNIPKILITINENNIVDGAKQILKIIRSNWSLDCIKFKFFTDGITNKLIGCFFDRELSCCLQSSQQSNGCHEVNSTEKIDINKYDDCPEDVVLIRIYGNNTELLIDRKAEQHNIRLLHNYGFAPSLFATFKNGLAYEYVPGCTLTPETIIQPKVWKLIAQKMAEMHKVKATKNVSNISLPQNVYITRSTDLEPMLWSKTQKFLSLIPEKFTDRNKHERMLKIFSSANELKNEFEDLYEILIKLNSPLVFAHNDLLLGNIIYNENKNHVTFIDFEYAAVNFQGFDIGNHFTEFTGIELDEIDYNRYPSKDFQQQWLKVYLKHYLDIDEEENVPKNEIERLYVQANQFALASHLFWVAWSLVQAEHSKIDFDFIKYADMRYKEYLAKKNLFLSLKL